MYLLQKNKPENRIVLWLKMLTTLLNNAISDYMIYQDKNPTSDDKTYVENKVKELQMLLAEYTVK